MSDRTDERYRQHTTKLISSIIGLSYIPTLEPHYSDWEDYPAAALIGDIQIPENALHFTELNVKDLTEFFGERKDSIRSILEIGVMRPTNIGDPSSTEIILELKHPDAVYIGIDMESRSFLDTDNVYTIQQNSFEKEKVNQHLDRLGMKQIDFLFIDGYHSVKVALNDWSFVERMPVGGRVAFHDTNYHPGPNLLFDAIDENVFKKRRTGLNLPEWGMGLCERIS